MPRFFQRGASLVELMISMALGFASLTAMSSLVSHGIGLNNSLMAKSRLDEEINSVLAVIEQDLKRAGYNGDMDKLLVKPLSFVNPFSHTLSVSSYKGEAANSCISFAYDRNQNGKLDSVKINEEFGFRLKDHAIEIRVDGKTCSQGYWQDLTDTSVIKVTKVFFDIEALTKHKISAYKVAVNIEAELVDYPEYSKHIAKTITIKNYD